MHQLCDVYLWAIQSFWLTVDVRIFIFIVDADFEVLAVYASAACSQWFTYWWWANHREQATGAYRSAPLFVKHESPTNKSPCGRFGRSNNIPIQKDHHRLCSVCLANRFLCLCFCESIVTWVRYGNEEMYFQRLVLAKSVGFYWHNVSRIPL